MKPEQKEQAQQKTPTPTPIPAKFRTPPASTNAQQAAGNLPAMRVSLTRSGSNAQDYNATLTILDQYRTSTGFKCPRCDYSTKDTDAFLEHITEEINKAITNWPAGPLPHK